MKNLKTYIIEAIKPPRLSAKNKELWKNGLVDEEVITEWLRENCRCLGDVDLSDGKINIRRSGKGPGSVGMKNEFCLNAINFPYPFGVVEGSFYCNACEELKSLKGAPEKVGGDFEIGHCPNLKSLEGAPKYVGGHFDCHDCGKQFTISDVEKVCNVRRRYKCMKDLKEYIELRYITEGIKPPRLSAKNRDLWKGATEAAIMKWIKENCNIEGKVEIVDGKINVNGDVFVSNKGIEYFPYPFGEVTGDFECSSCKKLKSLDNSPQQVGGYFGCCECNSLTSFEGAPEYTGKSFFWQKL